MSSHYGGLRPTSGWDRFTSLGHPANFDGFRVIGSVTARHSSSERQPNFAALNRGRHLCSAGRPSRWALAHILVVYLYCLSVGGQSVAMSMSVDGGPKTRPLHYCSRLQNIWTNLHYFWHISTRFCFEHIRYFSKFIKFITQSGAIWRKILSRTSLDRLLNKIDCSGVSKDGEDRSRPAQSAWTMTQMLCMSQKFRLDMQRGY